MTFARLVENLHPRPKRLTVLNRTEPDPVLRLLKKTFDGEAVEIRETRTVDEGPNDVLLLSLDREPLAMSKLSALRDGLLLVNSDTYITGTRGLAEVATPEVLVRLDDTRFRVAGYPAHEKQKMLLIEMSRYIEALAWRTGDGTLRAGFQYLSRLDDEYGTHQAYEDLATTAVEVHLYGVPDREPPAFATVHGSDDEELRRSWFVTFEHPDDGVRDAALLAVETDRNRWDGFWTHRPKCVAKIAAHAVDAHD